MIGLTDSPYHALQTVIWAKDLVLINIQEKENPFKWDIMMNNLPGTSTDDCCRSWVYKKRSYRSIAPDMFVYVDDGRTIGPTEEVCWEA